MARRRNVLILGVAGALSVGAAGCGEDEADRFSGEQRKIVEVIEEFRAGMDQADGPRVCRTFTAGWAQAIGEGAGGCEQWVRKEMEGARQAPIDVKEVRLRGARRAVADVVEKDEPLRVDFEKVGAAWKISRFSERSGSG